MNQASVKIIVPGRYSDSENDLLHYIWDELTRLNNPYVDDPVSDSVLIARRGKGYYTTQEDILAGIAQQVAVRRTLQENGVIKMVSQANKDAWDSHMANAANPHGVTQAQVGLGNVDNTSDATKPVSTAQQQALDLKANQSDLAAAMTNLLAPGYIPVGQTFTVAANTGSLAPQDTTIDGILQINGQFIEI